MGSKVALVTGSGKRRVGFHVAEALARKGYRLAVHYLHSQSDAASAVAQFRELGVDAECFRAEISSEQEVRALIESVRGRFGGIDVLVNAAAIWEPKPLEEVTAHDVRRHFEINALGSFLCAQHAGLAMVEQPDGGVIINLGDWAEIRPYRNYAAYFPSKGAVSAMTRSLAVELAVRNPKVRVNEILPGPVMLPDELSEEERREAIRATLVQREGSPQHVAQAVLFLVENDFLSGVSLPVDGGRSVYAAGY